MPRRPRTRRSRSRRATPPSPPPLPGTPQQSTQQRGSRRARVAAADRPRRLLERDAPYLAAELRRITMISAACIGLLVLLVLADRFA